jgi:hypothetical protein
MAHQRVFAGVLGFLLTSIATAASDDNNAVPSRPDDRIQAGTSTSSDWSRDALLSQILGGSKIETREQVLALLGPPNYTLDRYSAGYGLKDRFDTYRLSARNGTTNFTGRPAHRGRSRRRYVGRMQDGSSSNWRILPLMPGAAGTRRRSHLSLRKRSGALMYCSISSAPSTA